MKIIRFTVAVASILVLFIGTLAIFKYGIKMRINTIWILVAMIVLYTIISIPVIYVLRTKWQELKRWKGGGKIFPISVLIGLGYFLSMAFTVDYWGSCNSPARNLGMVVLPGETIKMKVSLLSVPEGCYRTTGQGFVQMENKDIFPVPIPIDYHHRKRWGNTRKSSGCSPGYNRVGYTPVEIPVSLSLPGQLNIKEPVELHGTVVMPLCYAKVKDDRTFDNVNEDVKSDVSFWAFPASWRSDVHRAKGYHRLTILFVIVGFFMCVISAQVLFSYASMPAKLKQDK